MSAGEGLHSDLPVCAFMEGLNSVFQATKRKARGYRNCVYMITMLYFVAGKLRLPAR